MPLYTLIVTTAAGDQHTTLSDFPEDRTAINDTGVFVSAEHPTVAVARDAGEQAHFLGAWDYADGEPTWSTDC